MNKKVAQFQLFFQMDYLSSNLFFLFVFVLNYHQSNKIILKNYKMFFIFLEMLLIFLF